MLTSYGSFSCLRELYLDWRVRSKAMTSVESGEGCPCHFLLHKMLCLFFGPDQVFQMGLVAGTDETILYLVSKDGLAHSHLSRSSLSWPAGAVHLLFFDMLFHWTIACFASYVVRSLCSLKLSS